MLLTGLSTVHVHASTDIRQVLTLRVFAPAQGSVLQLNVCASPPGKNQIFSVAEDGSVRQYFDGGESLCIAVPPRPPVEPMDEHSVVSDPLFANPAAGNFTLLPGSPAFALGFEPIPEITVPESSCGTDAPRAPTCLSAFFARC